jgi:dipeptidase D
MFWKFNRKILYLAWLLYYWYKNKLTMSEEIRSLKPQSVWENFFKLTQIPRPSKKELKAANFIKQFGENLGLETIMDKAGNVIIRKPATIGMENRAGIVLQAHIDMVPQANAGNDFNFETDAIDAYVEGEWVTARNTTLGADNGIGVAVALSILESKEIKHGPLEVLITVDEETGMTGAFALSSKMLNADILINLDSENEEDLSVGCAGGMNVNFEWKFQDETTSEEGICGYSISITGLKGGHSGLDIHLGKGNACKLMGQLLKKAISRYGVRLAGLNCGNMRNAIPREAFALVTIPKEGVEGLRTLIDDLQEQWLNVLGRTEPNLRVTLEESALPQSLIPAMVQDDVVNAVCAAMNGVIRMSDDMPGVVETSTNLSIIKSSEGKVAGMCLVRSFVDSAKENVASSLESCFELAGAKVTIDGEYPGWKPNPDSIMLNVMKGVYRNLHSADANVVAMHAGLECGILGAKYPKLDMIAVGPTICYPHSPDEKVNILSVERFYEFLVKAIGEIPVK